MEGTTFNFTHSSYSQLPTAADRDTYEQVKNSPPSSDTHPNLFAWYYLVAKFTDNVRNSWAAAGGAAKGGDKKAADTKKPEAKKEEAKPKDDDDMDLFGDDDAEDPVSIYLIGNANIKI